MNELSTVSPAHLPEQPSAYWGEQDAQASSRDNFAEAPLAPGEVTEARMAAHPGAAGEGIAINGNDRGTALPSKQTPDGKPITVTGLHEGAEATVTRERTNAGGYVSSDLIVLETRGGKDDSIRISQRDDGTLDVDVNGEQYALRLNTQQELSLRTGDGNDTIIAAPNVTVNLVIDAGAGDDFVRTGMGDDRIHGGDGNDTIEVIGGRNDIDGGRGDDLITAADGDNIIFGGEGADTIHGGSGFNFIEGGAGDDVIHGGSGHNVLSGGRGDDTLHADPDGRNYIYTGAGADTVEGAGSEGVVYAEVNDVINAATGARPTIVNVEIDPRAGQSVTVEGSQQFRDRIGAELDFLRSSPAGTRMLSEFDAAAADKGNRVTIQELANEQNGYAQTFGRAEIVNGQAGPGGDVTISYNPSFHMDAFPASTVVLYHEMSHAYNGVNGTFQPGIYVGTGPDSGQVPNAERQAVGLESSAPPYDFDGDPSTPPSTTNPIHLTENGLRRELGLPDRPSYAL